MCTSRSLTVCCSLLPGGVCLVPGGLSAWSRGFSLPGGLPGLGGLLGPGGVSMVPGGFSLPGGLPGLGGLLGPGGSPWSQGGSPCQGGLLGPGGSAWLGGVCLVLGGFSGDPPVYRITDTCKNITLATTSLRPVIRVRLTSNYIVRKPLCVHTVAVASFY